MKTKLIIFAALFASISIAQVLYNSPLRITKFDRATATLSWTNQVCGNVPVYQLLRTTTVTGNWQHFFYVTNLRSAPLTNSLGTNTGAVFHKLAWSSDTQMVFDYEFDEGFGFGPCIDGTLRVSLANIPSGTWQFEDDGFCFAEEHPTGSGNFTQGSVDWTVLPHIARLYFSNQPEGGTYLEGTLQQTIVNGECAYTGMSGTVYQGGFAGFTPIGTFIATRIQ
jgi:hypothetical protein